jgi:hypothetical protein
MPDNFQNNITTLARRLKPFIMSTAMATAAGQAVKIVVHHRDGAPAEYFDVTDAGWDLAAAACRDYDTITSPPASYSSAHTVPATVGYWGHGPGPTVHTATLTFSANSLGMDLRVAVNADDANEAVGLVGPATGTAWINRVSVGVTQAGSGAATGVKAGAGTLVLRDVPTEATANGAGTACALTCNDGGVVEIYEAPMEGIAGGTAATAYGVYVEDGDVSIWGGKCLGSTASFYRELPE